MIIRVGYRRGKEYREFYRLFASFVRDIHPLYTLFVMTVNIKNV